jgi:hypothetical protein
MAVFLDNHLPLLLMEEVMQMGEVLVAEGAMDILLPLLFPRLLIPNLLSIMLIVFLPKI